MPITVTFDPPQPSDSPAVFNSKAFSTLGNLNTWSGQANTVAGEVNTNAANAATSAGTASTHATTASTHATTATTKAGEANASAVAAAASASSASTSAGTATTQAGIATTKAAEAAASAASIAPGSLLTAANPSYTGTLTGGTGVVNLGSGQFVKDAAGNVGIGVTPIAGFGKAQIAGNMFAGRLGIPVHIQDTADTNYGNAIYVPYDGGSSTLKAFRIRSSYSTGALHFEPSTNSQAQFTNPATLTYGTGFMLDGGGNFIVGDTGGSTHRIKKAVGETAVVLLVGSNAGSDVVFEGGNGAAPGISSTVRVSKQTANGRSISAAGTINASGADYAEYEHNNGLKITKGSIVGFKVDGTLTLTYSEAVRFAVKSTAPGLVGGDTLGDEELIGKRPEKPMPPTPPYTGPAAPGDEPTAPPEGADEATIEAYAQARAVWQEAKAAHDTAMSEHAGAVATAQAEFDDVTLPAYEAEKAEWEARLEAARQLVDRIAYSGKVPCNVTGATPGDYIVATAAADGSITGVSVAEPDFAQYRKAVGRVNRLMPDGRCEVAVIIH